MGIEQAIELLIKHYDSGWTIFKIVFMIYIWFRIAKKWP